MKKFIMDNKVRCALSAVVIVGSVVFFNVKNREASLYPVLNFQAQDCKRLQMTSMFIPEGKIDLIVDGMGENFIDYWFKDADSYTQWVNKTAYKNIINKECRL